MEDTPEYVGDFTIRSIPRSEDVPLEVDRSLLAQCEIDSLRAEVLSLRLERDTLRKIVPDGEWVSYDDHKKAHDAASRLLVAIDSQLPIGCYNLICKQYDALRDAIYGREEK